MTALNWFRSGRSPSRSPRPRSWQGGRTGILVILAVVGLSATGCRSNPCGGGGGCGSGCGPVATMTSWWSNLSFHPFRHKQAACSTCGPVGAPIAEYGTPIVAPAPIAVPGGTVITPGPSSTVPPAGSGPSNLEPAPSASPGPPGPADTGARNSTGKASYEALRPGYGLARARTDALAPGEVPVLEPAPAPAAPPRTAAKRAVASTNPLDNLPPVDIPSMDDAAESSTSQSPPPAPAAVREPAPSTAPAPTPAETRSEAASAASAAAPVGLAPGIKRFAVVDSKLAGGSFPAPAGLDWLAEKGYKTFLDLRDPSEVQSASISLVTTHGLRYVALPIALKKLDADQVARFNLELALAESRPLYFCDTDGSRAGALWYIRRLTQDRIDPQVASREAEELGLTDRALWQAATRYLDTQNKAGSSPQAAAPASDPGAAPAPNTPAPAADASSNDNALPVAVEGPVHDPTAWSSCAALVVTSLSVPLAYWSASSFPTFRSLRASLPAPGRKPKSLPSGSDA